MLENCHNGAPLTPTKADCPMNFFRSSGDISPHCGSVLSNIESVPAYNGKGDAGPGCWAYPDMLEVAANNPVFKGTMLSHSEARAHFAAWCVLSSPLVLGFDLRNETAVSWAWDIIANERAIAVNQAYVGDAGTVKFVEGKVSP